MGFFDDWLEPAADAIGTATTGVPWGSVIDAGVGLFNGIMGADSQEATNAANAQQAQRQMDFQERMSNTAHQREVADLTAAGLNPILSVNKSGASSPSGAMAVMSSPYMAGVNAATGVSQSGLNRAHSALANQQTETESERTSQEQVATKQAKYIEANIDKVMEAKISQMTLQADISQSQAEILKQSIPKVALELENLAKEGKLLDAQSARSNIETVLKRLEVPEASAFAAFFSSNIGKHVPLEREVRGAVSSAAGVARDAALTRRFMK